MILDCQVNRLPFTLPSSKYRLYSFAQNRFYNVEHVSMLFSLGFPTSLKGSSTYGCRSLAWIWDNSM
jgi:hypothetical protein